jgi:hypothetical protein
VTVAGETDLAILLRGMAPELSAEAYVFATLPPGRKVPSELDPLMLYREAEGLTLLVEAEAARRAGLDAGTAHRRISLTIHSSLEAVGLIAAVAAALAASGIPVNPVSAYHHDHLFVPAERAEAAMEVLAGLVHSAVGSR